MLCSQKNVFSQVEVPLTLTFAHIWVRLGSEKMVIPSGWLASSCIWSHRVSNFFWESRRGNRLEKISICSKQYDHRRVWHELHVTVPFGLNDHGYILPESAASIVRKPDSTGKFQTLLMSLFFSVAVCFSIVYLYLTFHLYRVWWGWARLREKG